MLYFHVKRFILLIITLFFCVISCEQEKAPAEKIIRPVRYEQVFLQGGSRVRTFSGSTRSSEESWLSFKVGGTISKIYMQVGDKVQTGQVIAELDPVDYRLQEQRSSASLDQAKAESRNAKANYKRIRLLYENNSTSRNDLDRARAGDESAQAAMHAAQNQLELSTLQLSYTRLKAPTDGAIATVSADVNENVQAGEPIVQLISTSGFEVNVAVPGALISKIKEGAQVKVIFSGISSGKEFTATVTEVGVASTGIGTTFPVTVVLDQKDPEIASGLSVEVAFNFESSDKRERYVVPSFAVGEDQDGRFVFVVKTAGNHIGTIERKAVEIGELTADGIEIFDGLEDGDNVVTAGITQIRPGQKVKFK